MTNNLSPNVEDIDMNLIDEPKTIDRLNIDDVLVNELARSIKEIGLLQPIILRPTGSRYEIVAGHRRYLAHRKLQALTIRSTILALDDNEAALARASENLSRVDLTPIEEGTIYDQLINDHGMTVDQVAQKVGKTVVIVRRRMDLLKMPPVLQTAVHKKQISMTVAEELWPIADIADLEYYLYFAIENGCTRETARGWCKDWKDAKRRQQEPGAQGDSPQAPNEPRPVYVACDLCSKPMEIGTEVPMRICPVCFKTIKDNM